MVPSKQVAELRQHYELLSKQTIDPQQFTGALFSVVFEIITADTFIAGIASKILDGETIPPEERSMVGKPLLIEGRWWRQVNGQLFDVQAQAEILHFASIVEKLRSSCHQILSGKH